MRMKNKKTIPNDYKPYRFCGWDESSKSLKIVEIFSNCFVPATNIISIMHSKQLRKLRYELNSQYFIKHMNREFLSICCCCYCCRCWYLHCCYINSFKIISFCSTISFFFISFVLRSRLACMRVFFFYFLCRSFVFIFIKIKKTSREKRNRKKK